MKKKNKNKTTLPRDITATQAASLVENSSRDDDPRPGHSGARSNPSTSKGHHGKKATKQPSAPEKKETNTTSEPGKKVSEETKSNRSEHPKRNKNLPPLPPKGQPGGMDDPLRKGLSGAGQKWYLRYLAQRKTPEEAREGALKRKAEAQEASTTSAQSRSKARKRGREQISSNQGNAAKRSRGHEPQHPSGRRNTSYASTLTSVRVAILPEEYPEGGREELWNLKVYTFKPGMLFIDCLNENTAKWLMEIVPQLEGCVGPKLVAKTGVDIPAQHVITMFIPRSESQTVEKTLALIKAQNNEMQTDQWKVLSIKEEGIGQLMIFSIDPASREAIIKRDNTLRYRFGTVSVSIAGFKKDKKPSEGGEEATERMETASPATPTPQPSDGMKDGAEQVDMNISSFSLEDALDAEFQDVDDGQQGISPVVPTKQ
ncbi:hypothetical protein DMENIID0001_109300 [Sergentomyia squamirostris]